MQYKQANIIFPQYLLEEIQKYAEENKIDIPHRLDIRHIEKWDDRIENDVLICVSNKEHFKEVIKNSMGESNYLFIGYIENAAASLLAFHITELIDIK